MKDDMGSDASDIQLKMAFNQLQQNKNQNILMWGLTVQSFAQKQALTQPATQLFLDSSLVFEILQWNEK